MMTKTAKLATTANKANGMLTTVITVSLMYTDWTLTALRIQDGRHSSELSLFKANSFHTVESLRRRTPCCCSQSVSRMLTIVLE